MRRIPKYEKLILNKTYKKILKKKFGSAAGDKIFECIRSCLARGLDGDELENCVKECLKQKLAEDLTDKQSEAIAGTVKSSKITMT